MSQNTPYQTSMQLAAATQDLAAAQDLAQQPGFCAYADLREKSKRIPFQALVVGTTDRMQILGDIADAGLYLVCRRVIKNGTPHAVGVFPLIAHPDLGHDAADAHWRDVHAPLALVHHEYMTAYDQLSVVHRFHGLEADGFALCGFASFDDLKDRFYTTEEGVKIIANDVNTFADVKRSPGRLVATYLS